MNNNKYYIVFLNVNNIVLNKKLNNTVLVLVKVICYYNMKINVFNNVHKDIIIILMFVLNHAQIININQMKMKISVLLIVII
jgi:hypothetical protein